MVDRKFLEHVFVYGTLKRGQCREKCWPQPPVQVEEAWTFGRLYDLGPYPALLPGADRVLGEVWSFHPRDIAAVIQRLDQVEGTNQVGESNEYNRAQTLVTFRDNHQQIASVYFYADEELAAHHKKHTPSVELDGEFYAVWPQA